MITDKNDRFGVRSPNRCDSFTDKNDHIQKWSFRSPEERSEYIQLNVVSARRVKLYTFSSNSKRNVLIWKIMHFSVQLSKFLCQNPQASFLFFLYWISDHKNTRMLLLKARSSFTDKNYHRQKWSPVSEVDSLQTKMIDHFCVRVL